MSSNSVCNYTCGLTNYTFSLGHPILLITTSLKNRLCSMRVDRAVVLGFLIELEFRSVGFCGETKTLGERMRTNKQQTSPP